jgi:hypothetical protein
MSTDKEPQVVYNGVICKTCHDEISSNHRHDYVTCSCGLSFVDGGVGGYIRRSPDATPVVYFDTDPHVLIRNFVRRGTRGKNLDQPLKWVRISEMTDEHLVAVLDYGGADWHLKIIADELAYRNTNNIKLSEDEM